MSKWRKRFHQQRLAGLEEQPRTGRRPVFPPEVVVAVKAIACELPATLGIPLSRLNVPDIRHEVIGRGLVADISGTTIWRWLTQDAIKPWTHRSWIFPRDPDFETKAARVLDLYHRRWNNKPLRPDEYVISADEKTSIQARHRKYPTLPAAPGRHPRVEHEYVRGGATNYLARRAAPRRAPRLRAAGGRGRRAAAWRRVEGDVVPAAERNGLAILPYFPLDSGLLTGTYRAREDPDPSWRIAQMSEDRRDELLREERRRKVAALEQVAVDNGRSLLELAFSWLAARPVVASVIAGATRPEQVAENVAAADWVLDDETLAAIDEITG